MQAFFERYGAMVRYSCGLRTREALVSGNGVATGPHDLKERQLLQEYALAWLLRRSRSACVVVGMPSRRYVEDAIEVQKVMEEGVR